MEITCPNDKAKLGKVLAGKVVLNGGSLIDGSEFSMLIKCACGEFAQVVKKDDIITVNGKSENEPGSTPIIPPANGNEPGRQDGGSGEPNGSNGQGAGGGSETPGVNPEPVPPVNPLPPRPKTWIRKGEIKN